jgi:putative ABC transport system permease protein
LFHYDFVRGNPTEFFSNPFNVLLTESKAKKYFAAGDPIGQTLRIDSITYRVAAIVKDNPSNSSFQFDMLIPNDASALAEARAIWSRYITDAPFDYNFLDDEFNNLYKSDSKTSTLMLLFSVIAILISCLGLVGLAAFTARQRIKEIGIRKVLGATIPDIIGLLSWDFMRLVLLSVLIATPIAWWSMHLWLQDFAYHIPLGGWTFALAGAIAIGIALLTVSSQSVKAASANPVKNLRSE